MSTSHKLVPTTNPKYTTGSGLILEVSFDGSNWTKLKSAEPYSHNKPVSVSNQIKELERQRDGWVSNGPAKFRTAKFRIGCYVRKAELDGRVFVPHTHKDQR